MSYALVLTEKDSEAISWVGYRYAWADTLLALGYAGPGEHDIPEPDAWELSEAFQSDTEGGHSPFPCLDPTSDLYEKLSTLWESIV